MTQSKLEISNYLQHVFFFKDLEFSEIQELSKQCTVKKLNKGETLFMQGSVASAFYVLVYGGVQVYRLSPNGGEQTIHLHKDGEVIAEAAMFDDALYPANSKATKDSLLVRVPRTAFHDLLLHNPRTTLKVLSSYAKRLRQFVQMVDYLSLDDVTERVIKYLNSNAKNSNGEFIIELNISKKELAGYLGMKPETFSRVLKKLKEEQKIVEKNGLIYLMKSAP